MVRKSKLTELSGECPSCARETNFIYRGMQEAHPRLPVALYDCGKCRTTLSYTTIQRYNQARKEQTQN